MVQAARKDTPLLSESLDPEDFATFRAVAHELLDACLDHLQNASARPWQPASDDLRAMPGSLAPQKGIGEARLAADLAERILPYGTGNGHPRFFGWVHGTGLTTGLLAEMTAAAMNSNCGGRDHGAIYIERTVMDWARQIFGFPEMAGGLLTTGTSQATLTALTAARLKALGPAARSKGVPNAPALTAYCAEGAHSANQKALEVLGHGGQALRRIPTTGPAGGLDLVRLAEQTAQDRAAGGRPFCVIATAGSVNTGAFDDLDALADFCQAEDLWLHVDGAFGCWARLAEKPWQDLVWGIERADSLAFDFHKWMYVQYDCGALLVRDLQTLRNAFASRPDYLVGQDAGLAGGDPWYCDYGTDLSRGFRALKVWSALRGHGLERLGEKISDNCRQAARMGARVATLKDFRLAAPVVLNICCFRFAPPGLSPEVLDRLNSAVAQRLQLAGTAVFSTTKISGRTVLRAAITNHRTNESDIDLAMDAVAAAAAEEMQSL